MAPAACRTVSMASSAWWLVRFTRIIISRLFFRDYYLTAFAQGTMSLNIFSSTLDAQCAVSAARCPSDLRGPVGYLTVSAVCRSWTRTRSGSDAYEWITDALEETWLTIDAVRLHNPPRVQRPDRVSGWTCDY